MRRVANTLVHSLKDQIRGVRYSVRAEAQVPGSVFPLIHQAMEFGPLSVFESVIRTPALRVADGIFTQVEHAATDILDRVEGRTAVAFPVPVQSYFAGGSEAPVDFAGTVHRELTRLLRHYGARNMLVSEQALDTVWTRVLARHGDAGWLHKAEASRDRPAAKGPVLICAAIACEFARARPIQRVDLTERGPGTPRHLMLAPNLYCGLVLGLATAIVSGTAAGQTSERDVVIESADATTDARFERFKRAVDTKSDGAHALAAEFAAVLPFLP